MKKILAIGCLLISGVLRSALGSELRLPSLLPGYYLPALKIDGENLVFVKKSDANDVEQWIYATEDGSVFLSLELIRCDRPRSQAVFGNLLVALNGLLKDKGREFVEVTDREVLAKMYEGERSKLVFGYILPTYVQVWTYSTVAELGGKVESKFGSIKGVVNRQRYSEAALEGNVSMGFWGREIYEYASALLKDGRKLEAATVLRDILRTSPYNYSAHLDLSEITTDRSEARESLKIVFENAEDVELINRAAHGLSKKEKGYDSIPRLGKGETGLQLNLIPLTPCNMWLLDEAAKIYEEITGVPTKVRRLPEAWGPGGPTRIAYQRAIEEVLVGLKKKNIDFTGWTKDRYIGELRESVREEDALSRYQVRDLIDRVNEEPGQHLGDSLLWRFSRVLEKYRSGDERTMYVGITEVNIYSGDSNYVFSVHTTGELPGAGILSYYMMLGETLSAEYQSRRRLTERIAKELVPVSLNQLGIPRSTDPTCPYSYSSGVLRLDQKTLILSGGVREALKKIRVEERDLVDTGGLRQ